LQLQKNLQDKMISIKQIFIILSVMSLASAKKGISARNVRVEGERRGLKKGSKMGGMGGGMGGNNGGYGPDGFFNRDGTTVGELVQAGECIPFDDARKWITAESPSDIKCQQEFGQMDTTSACCRVFSFQDNGTQHWLLYDSDNRYSDLLCVCSENTGSGTIDTGSGTIDPGSTGDNTAGGSDGSGTIDPGSTGGIDRDGGDDSGSGGSINVSLSPTPAPGPNQCSGKVLGDTQQYLQNAAGIVSCDDSSQCTNNKCCFSNLCVCFPESQIVPGTSYCL